MERAKAQAHLKDTDASRGQFNTSHDVTEKNGNLFLLSLENIRLQIYTVDMPECHDLTLSTMQSSTKHSGNSGGNRPNWLKIGDNYGVTL